MSVLFYSIKTVYKLTVKPTFVLDCFWQFIASIGKFSDMLHTCSFSLLCFDARQELQIYERVQVWCGGVIVSLPIKGNLLAGI